MDEVERLQIRLDKLIQKLGTDDWGIAINELSKIGKPAVPALIDALKGRDRDVQKKPTQAIAKIEDLLKSKDTLVRNSIVKTLIQIGIPAVPELTGALKDKNISVHIGAAEALKEIGFDNIGFNEKIICLLLLRDIDEITKIGKPAIPALFKALRDEKMRWRAIQALGEIKDNSAVPELIEALGDKDRFVREGAAEGVSKIYYNTKTAEEFKELENMLQEGYDRLRNKHRKGDLTDIQVQIAKVKMAIARKKNELAEDKGVLLDDKPKPPKKGMYQQIRRLRNG